MDRRRAPLTVAVLLAACASDPDVRDPEARLPGTAAAWFAVKHLPDPRAADPLAHCDALLPAIGQAATKPGAAAPDPHRLAPGERWCVFAPEAGSRGPTTRSDGVAQRASGLTHLPAVAFWATDEAWSYAIFDGGDPVFAMESHYGDPQLIGDEARGAALLDVNPGALRSYLGNAHEPDVADAFASRIGAARPSSQARLVDLAPPKAEGPEAFDPRRHPPSPRLEPGQWAVLPPMGVVLVKAVNEDGTYTLVDDDKTFPIPIERAGGLHMRRLASAEDVAKALRLVEEGVELGQGDKEYTAERAQVWLDALKLGDLHKIAHTYATLCAIQSERALFSVELGLLATSREWLAEEIGTVQNAPPDTIDAKLVDACD